MKKFLSVFKFELSGYLKNKMFIGITVVIVLAIALTLSYPAIKSQSSGGGSDSEKTDKTVIYVSADKNSGFDKSIASLISSALGDTYKVEYKNMTERELKAAVEKGSCKTAAFMITDLKYDYIVENAGMYSTEQDTINNALLLRYRCNYLKNAGIDGDEAINLMTSSVSVNTIATGKDQTKTFMYTYVVSMILYMSLLLYGQFVAQSVAAEKSSRTMEMLITSTDTKSLIFGKVFGAGTAGLIQLVIIIFTAFGFYKLNSSYIDSEIIRSLFSMPLSVVLYTILFFVLGYFIYAFLYGSLASFATKLEDVSTLIMPVTFIYLAAFMIDIFAINTGETETLLMKVCSYIPLTAPIVMFTRITMGNPESSEIIISVVIQLVTIVLLGFLAAKIYKKGVLMYGNAPKLFKRHKKSD